MSSYITEIDIMEEAKDNFLTYAEEVLTDRAIPNAEDGLLSAQRKILWTAEEVLKMNSKSKFKKSASLVGSTLASSYYHGDAACYGVLCKMAQTYLMRYPLVEGEGSLGTQEANGMQASSRYTNAKPSIYADLMFEDFKKNTVPLKETYNGEYMEPVFLPSTFPNALVNGKESIGISLSHCSLPNNLSEICDGLIEYIKNKDITIEELMNFVKGPDFPLGGTVINSKDILQGYKSGHSTTSLKVRGDYVIEENKIIFTSIPYRTYRNKIKEQITKNVDELSEFIDDFNDESNLGENRLVFEIKKGVSMNSALEKIFALTDLQTTLSYNMTYIVNGTPKLCSLKDLMESYVNHQENVLIKATEFDKEKAEKRKHIVEGLLKAIDKIDEVIKIIKKSENKNSANKALQDYLSIDEIQANAILDMKLSKLTRIDKEELVNELEILIRLIAEYEEILSVQSIRYEIISKKILSIKEKYGDKRRTVLLDVEINTDKETKGIVSEDVVITIDENNYVNRKPLSSYSVTQKRNTVGKKNKEDSKIKYFFSTNTLDYLLVFTNLGKMYRILIGGIAEDSKYQSLENFVKLEKNEKIINCTTLEKDEICKYLLFVTKLGFVKKVSLDEIKTKGKKTGVAVTSLKDNDTLSAVYFVNDEDIMIFTKRGFGIRVAGKDIPIYGKTAKGIKGVTLGENDFVVKAFPVQSDNSIIICTQEGLGKRIEVNKIHKQNKGGKGLIFSKEEIADCAVVKDEKKMILNGNKSSLVIEIESIPILDRTSSGVKLIKNSQVNSISVF